MSGVVLCTLFDGSFAARGITLLASLEQSCPGLRQGFVRMRVHALDDASLRVLHAWKKDRSWLQALPPGVTDGLDAGLTALRKARSPAAFCWTLTPLVLRDALRNGASQAVYVDADLVFHADPLPYLARLARATASAHITPHGFAAHADHSSTVGRYCVQFLPVRNDPAGRAILDRWADQCLADCPEGDGARPPGDQGYLDEWMHVHGSAVAEWDEVGVGCGPWNRELHRLRRRHRRLEVARRDGAWAPLLFVHQQDVKWDARGRLELARLLSWPLDADWLRLSLLPYARTVARTARTWTPERLPLCGLPPIGFWPRWIRDRLLGRRR